MIFLGAGASTPFLIPTTSKLTDEIHTLLEEENEDLLTDIISFWEGCYEGKKPNYENILTILMGLTDLRRLPRESVVRAFIRDYPNYKKKYDTIIDEIYSRIVRYCASPFSSGDNYLDPYKLEEIFNKTYDFFTFLESDLVFTTNYDPSIEIWCQKRNIILYDGTAISRNPEIKQISPLDEKTVENGITNLRCKEGNTLSLKLVRLHGSIWEYKTKTNRKIKMNCPKDKLLFNDWYPFLETKPLMIFPGQESVLSSGDWDINYQYFKKMLRGNCLVIGYSFNDPLINEVFVNNLNRGVLHKIGILDPYPDLVVKNLFWNNDVPNDKIVQIPAKFGTDDALNRLYADWIRPIKGIKFPAGLSYAINNNVNYMNTYLQ